MPWLPVPLILLLLASAAFVLGRRRAFSVAAASGERLHSTAWYHGMLVALWCLIPALVISLLWLLFADSILTRLVLQDLPRQMLARGAEQRTLLVNDLHNLLAGHVAGHNIDPVLRRAAAHYRALAATGRMLVAFLMLATALLSASLVYFRIRPDLQARNRVEQVARAVLLLCSTIAVLSAIGIVLSILFESIRFFRQVPLTDFLFGLKWSPQMAMRADQVGSSGSFGVVPVLAGTLLISAIALAVAVPVGLMSAIYLSEYAGPRLRAWARPTMEILAGVPTVVYGFFAALVVAPFIHDIGARVGLDVSSESALASGLVMGIMIIPSVSSLSDDVINAVPRSLRDGSYGLGATRSETIIHVVLPAALPGIVGGILLAASRAIGETMIVVMAAGLAARLTANPLEAVTTVTVQIVTLLAGDQAFDSPRTLAAFALGLLLFVVTMALNMAAMYVVRRYREEYE